MTKRPLLSVYLVVVPRTPSRQIRSAAASSVILRGKGGRISDIGVASRWDDEMRAANQPPKRC